MAKRVLVDSHRAGVPLAVMMIVLTDGGALDDLIRELDELAPDFEVSPHWMHAMSGEDNALTAGATKEALKHSRLSQRACPT